MNVENCNEIHNKIRMQLKDMIAIFAKSLELEDQAVSTWLTTQLAILAVLLRNTPPDFGAKVIAMLLDVLPDRVANKVVMEYIERLGQKRE